MSDNAIPGDSGSSMSGFLLVGVKGQVFVDGVG
jgi:hypothetical protein